MEVSRLFLLFTAYSMIGWICEVIYCSALERRFINRGFFHGPVCPVYGFGGLLVIFLLEPWQDTWLLLFAAGMCITSLLEYVTSWILEMLFNTKWWDYSGKKCNLHGRICLLNSVLFGVMGVVAVHFVHPAIMEAVMSIPGRIAKAAAYCIGGIFLVDGLCTVRSLVNLGEYMAKLQEFCESLRERYENEDWFPKVAGISDMFAAVKNRAAQDKTAFNAKLFEKIESFSARKNNIESFFRRFPTMSSRRYAGQLEHIRGEIARKIIQRKAELIALKAEQAARKNAAKKKPRR